MSIESSLREYFHAAAQRLTEPADSLFEVYRRARRRRVAGLTIIAIAAVIVLAVAVAAVTLEKDPALEALAYRQPRSFCVVVPYSSCQRP